MRSILNTITLPPSWPDIDNVFDGAVLLGAETVADRVGRRPDRFTGSGEGPEPLTCPGARMNLAVRQEDRPTA